MPYLRTRYATRTNTSAIAALSETYDAVICSWEPFDALVRYLSPPVILIAHNISSQALPAIYPGSLLSKASAMRAASWERKWYRASRFAAIAALSRADLDYLEGLDNHPPLLWTPPGMPPSVDLDRDAKLVNELVLSGTYGWRPKRRDAILFAREYATLDARLPVRTGDLGFNGLVAEATGLLQPLPLTPAAEDRGAMRFGLITDRFQAGHKLKSLAYVANNQIVLSYAEVSFDFHHIPDSVVFIRRIRHASEIAAHVRAVASVPDLRDRFIRFKEACARAFTWDKMASSLFAAVQTFRSKKVDVE
jgi:hypothetical protein